MSRLRPPIGSEDHMRGPADAPVTLVEYGDFECPFCGRAHYELEKVFELVGDITRLVFRHFPLAQAHPHAMLAAQAAEAAGAQGKFWEMHDTLFENQDALEVDDLLRYAQDLDLDVPRFAEELAGEIYLPRVMRDFQSGVRSGVNGTPTFFIEDVRFDGSWAAPSLAAALMAAARRKGVDLAGVPA